MNFIDIINSDEFINASPLSFVIGADESKNIVLGDLKREPHYLIGGRTASGKTNILFSVVISLLLKNKSSDLKLLVVNGKSNCEFDIFDKIDHVKILQDFESFSYILNYLVNEMELRYSMFMNEKVRNIDDFNNSSSVLSGKVRKLPHIVLLIDDSEILTGLASYDEQILIENNICALLQKARASGIHIIMTTQSASRIPANMLCNIVGRIAFNMYHEEYRYILNSINVPKLNNGECLYKSSYSNTLNQVKVPLVDINTIQELIKLNNK